MIVFVLCLIVFYLGIGIYLGVGTWNDGESEVIEPGLNTVAWWLLIVFAWPYFVACGD